MTMKQAGVVSNVQALGAFYLLVIANFG